ncbi:hypothetical protein SNK04_003793 [Fusarium graminearum]
MWITKAIVRSEHCGGIWPPGFHSLQNVAVDVSIGLSPDQDDDEIHGAGLATLLHLPHIKNLYYCKPSPNREDEEDEDFEFYKLYRLPTGTSSVESIFLDCPDNLPEEFYDALASAPKGLDTFAIRATCSYEHILNDVDSLVSALADKNPQLKRLIVYNGMGLGSEYEGVFSCPPSDFKCFEAIKHLSIGADDFENEGSCHAHGQDPDIVDDEWFHNVFPPNVEAIYVWGGRFIGITRSSDQKPSISYSRKSSSQAPTKISKSSTSKTWKAGLAGVAGQHGSSLLSKRPPLRDERLAYISARS